MARYITGYDMNDQPIYGGVIPGTESASPTSGPLTQVSPVSNIMPQPQIDLFSATPTSPMPEPGSTWITGHPAYSTGSGGAEEFGTSFVTDQPSGWSRPSQQDRGFLSSLWGDVKGLVTNPGFQMAVLPMISGALASNFGGGATGTLGGIDAGVNALPEGLSAADAAAGMVPEYGTIPAYNAAMASSVVGPYASSSTLSDVLPPQWDTTPLDTGQQAFEDASSVYDPSALPDYAPPPLDMPYDGSQQAFEDASNPTNYAPVTDASVVPVGMSDKLAQAKALWSTTKDAAGVAAVLKTLGLGNNQLKDLYKAITGQNLPGTGSPLGGLASLLGIGSMAALMTQKAPPPVAAHPGGVGASGTLGTGNWRGARGQNAGRLSFYAKGGLADRKKAFFNHMRGNSGGQADDIPAMLSPGEYIMDAETVSHLGDGNNAAGAEMLDMMRHNIRKHKRSGPLTQIAPKSKAPEHYLPKGKG